MWPYFVPRLRDYEGLAPYCCSRLGRLAELWRVIRMWPYFAPKPLSLAPSDLPPPIGPLTPAHDLCGYPFGLEGLGACAPAQSRYSFHDGLNFRYRGGIRRALTRILDAGCLIFD